MVLFVSHCLTQQSINSVLSLQTQPAQQLFATFVFGQNAFDQFVGAQEV